MDSMEFNKIAGAVLSALLIIFGGSTLVHEMTKHHDHHGKVGYKLPVEAASASASAATAKEADPGFQFSDVLPLLATANVEAGAKNFRKCSACHTVDQGGKNKVGPNLWNIVNKDKGAVEGFKYSTALAEKEGNWTFENLALFLNAPKGWLPGTKMSFAGLRKPKDVAEMLAYLRTLSDAPAELPAPAQ